MEILWLLAQANAGTEANEALERVISLLDGTTLIDGRLLTRTDALIELAQQNGDDHAFVRRVLDRIDLSNRDVNGSHALQIAKLFVKVADYNHAIAATLRARELGRRPNFQLGRLCELEKKYYEAIRWYNRDIAEGSEDGIFAPPTAGETGPGNGAEAREQLLQKLPPDFLIEHFASLELDPLTEEERRRVVDAVARFESSDLADRDAAEADLRSIGFRATPYLREALKANDAEVRARLRALLSEWAEPK
ncbi:MAG: hypothetical protein HYY16_07020 [Planctomycetes bacterium]|nr:hypothetical protein [Planctomycetota bacterium]